MGCIDTVVLASDPCSSFLDGYKVKMTGKNFQKYTIKEKMQGQLCKNWKEMTGSFLILAKTAQDLIDIAQAVITHIIII